MKNALIFLFGFSFGVVTLVIFRREVGLQSQIRTVGMLLALGGSLTGCMLYWLNLLKTQQRQSPQNTKLHHKWAEFTWIGTTLTAIYLALVLIFLVF